MIAQTISSSTVGYSCLRFPEIHDVTRVADLKEDRLGVMIQGYEGLTDDRELSLDR